MTIWVSNSSLTNERMRELEAKANSRFVRASLIGWLAEELRGEAGLQILGLDNSLRLKRVSDVGLLVEDSEGDTSEFEEFLREEGLTKAEEPLIQVAIGMSVWTKDRENRHNILMSSCPASLLALMDSFGYMRFENNRWFLDCVRWESHKEASLEFENNANGRGLLILHLASEGPIWALLATQEAFDALRELLPGENVQLVPD